MPLIDIGLLGLLGLLRRLPRRLAHYAIRAYQLSFSAIIGRQCRYLPSCSAYMDEAIARHGLWAGGFTGLARLCRCHPWGGHGFDPVPAQLPAGSTWFRPWRYGDWRGPRCEAVPGVDKMPQSPETRADPSGA